MKWLLAGASGFLGTALRVRLATEGHDVVRLVRREPATAAEFRWDPDAGRLDRAAFDGVDVVVNLAGTGVFDKLWTTRNRERIVSSRANTTGTLARTLVDLAGTGSAPALIQASGVAHYGTARTEQPHTEDSPAANDFLAQVTVVGWERPTEAAAAAGVRVVLIRTSPVLDHSGGPFPLMKLAWSLGAGAKLGDGRQRMPMISLQDYLGIVQWAAATPSASGPYNATIPQPTTNAEFTEALARAVRRPCFIRAPGGVLRRVLGEQAEQLLGDMYILPQRLTDQGFRFADPDVTSTVATALAKD